MAILGNLLSGLGLSQRRAYGGFMNRGYGRSRAYGRGRMSGGRFGGSLRRMTLGGLAAYAANRFFNRRSVY